MCAQFWDEFWAADLPALDSTVAEIRSTTFAQTLSKGRQALTTGINEAWSVSGGCRYKAHASDENPSCPSGSLRHIDQASACVLCRYFDHGISEPRFIQDDWEPYYNHDPFEGLSKEQMDYVLGGEVDMWGEGVDATNFESRVFPWATAVGERLWSPAAQTYDKGDTESRLTQFRCLLVKRGIRAAPVGPGAPC